MSRVIAVLVVPITENLVLQTKITLGAILHSTVAGFRDFPLDAIFKVLVGLPGDNVTPTAVSVDDAACNTPSPRPWVPP